MNAAEKKFEELKDLLGTSLDAILLCKEKLIERNHDEIYAELLDEIYGEVSICGLTYSAGYALRECDPVAFRCGLHDYLAENAIELGDCHFYDWQIEELIEETKTDMEFGHFKRDTDRHGYA